VGEVEGQEDRVPEEVLECGGLVGFGGRGGGRVKGHREEGREKTRYGVD
jgi:hypothetical protein